MFVSSKNFLQNINVGDKDVKKAVVFQNSDKGKLKEVTKNIFQDTSLIDRELKKYFRNEAYGNMKYCHLLRYRILLTTSLIWLDIGVLGNNYTLTHIELKKEEDMDFKIKAYLSLKNIDTSFHRKIMNYLGSEGINSIIEKKTPKQYEVIMDYENFDKLYEYLYESFKVKYDYFIDYYNYDSSGKNIDKSQYNGDLLLMLNMFNVITFPLMQSYTNTLIADFQRDVVGYNNDFYQKAILLFSNLSWFIFECNFFKNDIRNKTIYMSLISKYRKIILNKLEELKSISVKDLILRCEEELKHFDILEIDYTSSKMYIEIDKSYGINRCLNYGKVDTKSIDNYKKDKLRLYLYI